MGSSAARRTPALPALGLVVASAPVATDAYLAALPALQHDLHTSSVVAQASLTTYLIGFAAGQLSAGPLSDRRGRRPVLLAGLVAFVLAGILTAATPGAAVLLAARLVQGLGGGAAGTAARGAVADAWTGRERAERIATMSAMQLAGPIVAPVLGSLLLTIANWRAVMALPAAIGTVALIAVLALVPETRPREVRSTRPGGLLSVLRRGGARRELAVSALAGGAQFAYVAASPFIFRIGYQLTATEYGLLFAGNAAVTIAGSLAARLLVRRLPLRTLQRLGFGTAAAAAALLLGLALTTHPALWAACILLGWPLFAATVASVATSVQLQNEAEGAAGSAAGLQGAVVFAFGALLAPLTGLAGTPTLPSTEVVILSCFLGALIGVVASRWRRGRSPGPRRYQ